MNEDEVAANFSFMTVENTSKDEGFMRRQRKKEHEGLDAHSNKVWWTVFRNEDTLLDELGAIVVL